MIVKTVYIEPEDYFPEEIRKKYKLGEYNTDEDEDETEDESSVTEIQQENNNDQ